MISIAKPNVGAEEKEAVCKIIDSGMIACGKVTEAFEEEFSSYIGTKHGIATTSGTTALEVAIKSLGIGKGDKVLTTAFSFIATANAILYSGAIPVFVDIEEDSYNIDPDLIEEKLQEQPEIKAVLIVHLFGLPCRMDRIKEIVDRHHVMLIEDCAQAHGAFFQEKKVGSFGDAAAFSFYPTKNMTTGEGGIVLTNHDDVAKKARLLINHGMEIRYHHKEIGYNYRMTNMAAAMGQVQLSKLERFNERRRANADRYICGIHNTKIIMPEMSEGHVFHQFTIRVKDGLRDRFTAFLEENGVGYGVFYPLSMPEQECYKQYGFETHFPIVDCIKQEVVSIPVHPLLTDEEVDMIISVINRL